jgi:hypothetical protein
MQTSNDLFYPNKKIFVDYSIVLPSGKHSCPIVLSNGENRFVLKKSSVGKDLTIEEANLLVLAVEKYHSKLQLSGLTIPKLHFVRKKLDKRSNTSYFIESLHEFVGKHNALDQIIYSKDELALITYKKILFELYNSTKKCYNELEPLSSVLIDANPRNFVENKDGKMYFVDFYAPKLLDENGKIYPFIERLHNCKFENNNDPHFQVQMRCQDKRVLFQILLSETVAEKPVLKKELEEETLCFLLERNETELVNYLQEAIKSDYELNGVVKVEVLKKIPKTQIVMEQIQIKSTNITQSCKSRYFL